jgi:hypothetical protein
MTDLERRAAEVSESAAGAITTDPELASFTQNIVKLESLLFRTETEIFLAKPNIDRLRIFLSEMQSLQPELHAQQQRVMAQHGAEDGNVQRLQSLLSGRLMAIVKRSDEIVANAQKQLDAIKRGESPSPVGLPPPRPPVDSAIDSGDDGSMEPRIKKLEDLAEVTRGELRTIDVRLTKIETRLEGMDGRMNTMATKGDVAGLESTMLKWFIGTTITMVGLAFAAAKLIH